MVGRRRDGVLLHRRLRHRCACGLGEVRRSVRAEHVEVSAYQPPGGRLQELASLQPRAVAVRASVELAIEHLLLDEAVEDGHDGLVVVARPQRVNHVLDGEISGGRPDDVHQPRFERAEGRYRILTRYGQSSPWRSAQPGSRC